MTTPSQADIRRRDRFAALVLLVLIAALAVALVLRRSVFDAADVPERARSHEAIEFGRVWARRDSNAENEWLTVVMRLRTTMSVSLPCYVFVLAHNDQATPRLWGIWPPQTPGASVSAGGHFNSSSPASGQAVTLTDQWERIEATIPQQTGALPFESIEIYVVDPDGRILLSRPFKV